MRGWRGDGRGLLAVAVAVLLLAGCGGRTGADTGAEFHRPLKIRELAMTLDGYYGPQNVAVLMAANEGYFNDLGLYVSANTPLSPVRPIPYVVTGIDDIGISHQPEVELTRREGAPIATLGPLVEGPTAAMIWLEKSKVGGIAGLEGKTIGIPGLAFQGRLLGRILARAGLTLGDVEVEKLGYDLVPALVAGRVDAIFGGSANLEGVELEARGMEPVITPVESLGVPSYDELVVIARDDLVEEEPDLVRDFMSALYRGSAAAVEDPRAALEAIEASTNPNPDIGRRALRAELDATLPLLAQGAS
ncbi:MAG TPA: ABC transporter substrate-binding protein [Solirubrobacterales bacterium]|nr:ABC transporter substrate-binding protein [Solirubrobacterales bacterium]